MSKHLSPGACADTLNVTSEFIRGEIREGRLPARVFKLPSGRRSSYRIDPLDFAAYVERYWPKCSTGNKNQSSQ